MKKALLFVAFISSFLMVSAQTDLNEYVDFTAVTIEKDTFNLEEFWEANPDTKVALEFFFTESRVCKETSEQIQDAYKRFGCNEHDVYFLSINVDNDTTECQAYIDELNYEIPMVSGLNGNGDSIASWYNIDAYPTLILLSKEAMYRTFDTVNEDDEDVVDSVLTTILNQDIWPIVNSDMIVDSLNSDWDNMFAEFESCEESSNPAAGIFDAAKNEDLFQIYPNPNNGLLYLNTENLQGQFTMEILDLSGKSLYVKPFNSVNEAQTQINVQHLNKGVYLLRLFNQEFSSTQKLLIE